MKVHYTRKPKINICQSNDFFIVANFKKTGELTHLHKKIKIKMQIKSLARCSKVASRDVKLSKIRFSIAIQYTVQSKNISHVISSCN